MVIVVAAVLRPSDPTEGGEGRVVVPSGPTVDNSGEDEADTGGPAGGLDQTATTVWGALPDGTRYELQVPEHLRTNEVEGISGVVVWADGPTAGQAIGSPQQYRFRQHLPPYESAEGRTNVVDRIAEQSLESPRLLVEAGRWAFFVDGLTQESLDRQHELELIEAREHDGLIVLDLPSSLRFAYDGELPVEMQVTYRDLRVINVNECGAFSFGVCSPDGKLRVVATGVEADTDPDADLSGLQVRAFEPVPPTCPITVPDGEFVPPEDHPPTPPDRLHAHWYGAEDLWVTLDRGGEVWRPSGPGGRVAQRFPLWSVHQGRPELEPEPDVKVRADRLDGDASTIEHRGAAHGWTRELPLFMLSGIELPTPGCWQITAEYRDAALSWVVWVLESEAVVPDVEGLTLAEATERLGRDRLAGGPSSDRAWSDPTDPDAIVVHQAPPPGIRVKAGDVVGLRTALVNGGLCDILTELPNPGGDARDLAGLEGYWDVLRRAGPHAKGPLADHIEQLLVHHGAARPLDTAPSRALDSVVTHHRACNRS